MQPALKEVLEEEPTIKVLCFRTFKYVHATLHFTQLHLFERFSRITILQHCNQTSGLVIKICKGLMPTFV